MDNKAGKCSLNGKIKLKGKSSNYIKNEFPLFDTGRVHFDIEIFFWEFCVNMFYPFFIWYYPFAHKFFRVEPIYVIYNY